MTVAQLKTALERYDDNAEVIVAVSDNSDDYYPYNKCCYDMWVEGNKDEKQEGELCDRNPESTEIYIKLYR